MIIETLYLGNTTVNIHDDYIPKTEEENTINRTLLDTIAIKIIERQSKEGIDYSSL